MVKKDLQFRNDFQKNLLNLNNFKKFSLKFNDIFQMSKQILQNQIIHFISYLIKLSLISLKKIQKYKKSLIR